MQVTIENQMTIQDYLKEGNSFASLKNKPIKDGENTVFIHEKFFTQEALEEHKRMWSECPDDASYKYKESLYGGDTPDAKWVDWIYTYSAIVTKETAYDVPEELDIEKMFTYHGWHFIPAGPFKKYLENDDFKTISVNLKSEWKMKLYDYEEEGNWNHKLFYKAANLYGGNCTDDVFFCVETQKYHVPGKHELFILNTNPL